jgi:hypothetical protein
MYDNRCGIIFDIQKFTFIIQLLTEKISTSRMLQDFRPGG